MSHEPETPDTLDERLASELLWRIERYLEDHTFIEDEGLRWAGDASPGASERLLAALDAYIDHRIRRALRAASLPLDAPSHSA